MFHSYFNLFLDATLCITHLSEVRSALREGKFKNSSWIDLGDGLGLHPNTLSTIETNYPRDSDRCARECLVKWLDRADGVDEKGGANWKTLSNALEAAGQKNAADYISKLACIKQCIINISKDHHFFLLLGSLLLLLNQPTVALLIIQLPIQN